MMDFSGLRVFFYIFIAIFIGVAGLYIMCAYILVKKKKKMTVLPGILFGILIIPAVTILISYVLLIIASLSS